METHLKDYHIARGYDAAEIKRQEYRSLCFWGSVVTVAIILFFLIAAINGSGGLLGFTFLLLTGRVVMALAKAYYRKVYDIKE